MDKHVSELLNAEKEVAVKINKANDDKNGLMKDINTKVHLVIEDYKVEKEEAYRLEVENVSFGLSNTLCIV
jgi:hypothetical protein